jgi:DNA-binding transcriptional LysR family regulator
MKPDYQILKPLAQILRHRNLSQAGAAMNMSQPAMSRIFEKAKHQFEDELMVRSGNSYFLTPKGERLIEELSSLLPAIDQLWTNEIFEPLTCEKEIKIAGADLDLEYILPQLLNIQKSAPKLKVSLRQSHPSVLQSLSQAELDIVITAFDQVYDGLYRELIKREPYVALVSENHFSPNQKLTMDEYLSRQHGIFAFDESSRWSVDKQLHKMGHRRYVTLSLPSFSQIRSFISDSPLIFSLPEQYARQIARETNARVLPLPFAVPEISIYLYWHKRLSKDPLNKWLRSQILTRAIV